MMQFLFEWAENIVGKGEKVVHVSQTINFRLFQTERVCKRQFYENCRKSPKGWKALWEKTK